MDQICITENCGRVRSKGKRLCGSCRGKKYRFANPNMKRSSDLKSKFSITLEEYEEMVEAQKGLCAICGQPEKSKRNGNQKMLAVDHNHKTNEIRKLLCSNCNVAIGLLQENPELLREAARYLESF